MRMTEDGGRDGSRRGGLEGEGGGGKQMKNKQRSKQGEVKYEN